MSQSPPEPAAPAPPLVADHAVLRRIGVGAYGEVWLARNVTGLLRAVKVVWRSRFEHERTYEREFAGLKRFEPISRGHEGLGDILQIGRDDQAGYFYYVMELADDAETRGVPGEPERYRPLTLAEHIRQRGRCAVSECARVGAAIADALAFLHAQGLVHRDVKPSNIIYVGGRPKLVDVGLVAGLGEARSFVGTEGFIAPEGPGSPQSDLYSLGKLLYEMATGRSRLDFPDLPGDLHTSPDQEAFAELNEAILRACASEPNLRHANAAELHDELLMVEAGRSVRRMRRNERLIAGWRRASVVASGVGLAVLGALFFEHQRGDAARQAADLEARQRQALEEREQAARQNLYAADVNLAQQAIEAGNYGRAEELLADYIPRSGQRDLRGFEWFYYWQRVRGGSSGVLRGHEQVVSSLALSRDGQRLYSASFDQTVREWSLAERREARRWTVPGCLFMAVALDPRQERLAGEGGNRPFSVLLDLATGGRVTNVSSASPSVAFTPDGQGLLRGARMLLFDTNGVVELTDLAFNVQRVLDASGGRVAVSPDGNLLATGPWGDAIQLWSWPNLTRQGTLRGAGTVLALSFSPDGGRLASVSREGRLQVWDLAAHQQVAARIAHGGGVIWSVAYSPDGVRLATGGNDQTIRTWDSTSLEEQHVFRGHRSEVWAVLWSADGQQLISAGKDATIRLWNATPPLGPPDLPGVVQAAVFSADGRLAALRLRDGAAVIRDVASGRTLGRLESVDEIAGFAPDGQSLLVLSSGWRLERRALAGGRVLEARPLRAPPDSFSKRLWAPDGRWLATGLRNGQVWVHDTTAGDAPFLLAAHREMVVALAFSPTGKQLLSGSVDRTACLWDLERRRSLHTFTGHRMAVGAAAFSADGARIATGSWDDTVHVWDAVSWQELAVLGGHEGGVQAVAFAPCNRTLVSLAGNSILKFWSLGAKREAGTMRLPPGTRQGWVSLSPGGQWLAAVSQGEVLSLLPAPRGNGELSR